MIAELATQLTMLRQWAGDNLWPICIFLVMVNAYAFILFAIDKNRAIAGGHVAKRRIPENTLLGLALFGGSPALVLGQKLLNHKTRKQPFGLFLFTILLLHILLAAGLVVAFLVL